MEVFKIRRTIYVFFLLLIHIKTHTIDDSLQLYIILHCLPRTPYLDINLTQQKKKKQTPLMQTQGTGLRFSLENAICFSHSREKSINLFWLICVLLRLISVRHPTVKLLHKLLSLSNSKVAMNKWDIPPKSKN